MSYIAGNLLPTNWQEYGVIDGSLTITGDLTVQGNFTFGDASTDILTVNGQAYFPDNIQLTFGNSAAAPDVKISWNTTQTVDAFFVGLATAQNTLIIAEAGDIAYDFAHGAQTNPTLYIQSATQSATQWGSLTHDQTDFLISSGAGAVRFAPATNVTATLPAAGKLYINGTTTAQTNTAGALDIDVTSLTANNTALNLSVTNTATTGNSAYSIYNVMASSAVVTGTNQFLYGIYNTVTKTGADTNANTTTLYGAYLTASNTGSTDTGTKNTYGIYATATGDTAGTSTAYGGYFSAASGDTNWGIYVNAGVAYFGGSTRIPNNTYSLATNNAGSGTINLFKGTTGDEIDVGAVLNVGQINLPADAGAVVLVDMPVSDVPAAAAEESYAFAIDSNNFIKLYAEADSAGGIQNGEIKMYYNTSITSATTAMPTFSMTNTTDDATGPTINLISDRATPADQDVCGTLNFQASDSAGTQTNVASIIGYIEEVADGDEAGRLVFNVMFDDGSPALQNILDLKGDDNAVGQGAVIINEDGKDFDVRVETTTTVRAFTINGLTGDVKHKRAEFYDEFWNGKGAEWATRTTSGAVAAQSVDGGVLRLTTGAADDNEESLDFNDICTFANTKRPSFEIGIQMDQASAIQVRAGLTESAGVGTDDFICFRVNSDTDTNWYLVASDGGAETVDAGPAAGTSMVYFRWEFLSDTTLEWFYSTDSETWTSQGTVTTNVPTEQLQPFVEVIVRNNGGARYINVDYVKIHQDRT